MKSRLLIPALLLAAILPARADLLLKPNDTLAICGDSITEQKLYSVMMEDYLLMCQPVEGLRIAQFGWSGERAPGFLARIGTDVLPFHPTVATTCYGMNDGGYRAMAQPTGDAYRDGMSGIVKKLTSSGVRTVIVGSPGCVDPASFPQSHPTTPTDVYNQTLDALRGIASDVAQKVGMPFADLHTPMMDVMTKSKAAYGDTYQLVAGGGVHPNSNGQLVMAYAFLKALGCDGAIATITVDIAAGQATGTPGQKIVSYNNGEISVQSTRYPFCFQGEPGKPTQLTASVITFFPFNDDLNRYLLVVKNLKGSKAKITWGTESKEFPAADLEKGVNLAAEFLVNPFATQFGKVNDAVVTQQGFESPLVKQYLHSDLATFKSLVPDEAPAVAKIQAALMKHDQDNFNAAQALVTPVDHKIQITAEP